MPKIELNFWDRWIAKQLKREPDKANAIIEATFPGYRLRRIRKDAGTKKIRGEKKDGE